MRKLLSLGRRRTAKTAKDRLHIIIAQERSQQGTPDFLPMLRKDILEAIKKYVDINLDDVQVGMQQGANNQSSMLELNIVLPEMSKNVSS